MKPEDQNEAIARVCGTFDRWVLKKRGVFYREQGAGYTCHLSDAWVVTEEVADKHVYPHDTPVTKHRAPQINYVSSLDAMHEAEKVLIKQGGLDTYRHFLRFNEIEGDEPWYGEIHATATQRAKAFLKTFGLWLEAEGRTQEVSEGNTWSCRICGKRCKSERGLSTHKTRKHFSA